jgi:phospholipase A1
MFGIGVNHQSNGRADPISRSWNRVVANIGLDREDWAVMIRPWWRIPDSRNEDENPGIEDYIGRGDITLVHRWNEHEFALMGRHSLRTGDRSRGAMQFDWGFPVSRALRGHVQVFVPRARNLAARVVLNDAECRSVPITATSGHFTSHC